MKATTLTTALLTHFCRSLWKGSRLGLVALTLATAKSAAEPIKVGIIGLDAHAVPWTRILHDPQVKPPLSEMRVVAAVPVPSADVPFSADNIAKNTEAMRGLGVEILNSIDELVGKVDAVMLLSIDGRPHPAQAEPVFRAKKPLFIDKPVTASLVEAVEIFRRAAETGTPCFTNSALRYGPTTAALASDPKLGRILGAETYCNVKSILPGHPDLFYYGIHGCDWLFTIMGPGCETVARTKTATTDLSIGTWADGRVGVYRGIAQGATGWGATAFGEKSIVSVGKFEGYEPLLAEIAKFFRTGQVPISVEHTLEIYAFMEAADESLRQGGRAVSLARVLEKAKAAAGRGAK